MRRIIRPGRNAWQEATADASGLIVDAADYYHAIYWRAQAARRYILMSGWQFDSGVPLLRGDDVPAGAEVRLLKFLNGLCEQKPDLHIYIVAWDFHLVFAGEREWMQRVLFHWMTNSRLHFRFDDCPVPGGSHHQKFVVIDGTLAFLGGMDICESRWDDRRHLAVNPLRLSHGKPAKPYHDAQVYIAGRDVVAILNNLFLERWKRSGGDELSLLADPDARRDGLQFRGALDFGPATVAFSRTDPRSDAQTIREVERLFLDAIDAAECLIYIETQYFSSRRIYEALVRRMRATDRDRLQIVVIVNERAEALKEEIAVGLRQAETLQALRRVAADTDHALGLYWAMCDGANETFRATYIHSKLIVVDDRFLTVGSANLTNRSMGIDSELHASWEAHAESGDVRDLTCAIRRTRVNLLAEHSGVSGDAADRQFAPVEGLVARLDALARQPNARLKEHGPPTPAQVAVMEAIDPQALPFDPETADDDDAGAAEPADEAHRRRRLVALRTAIGSLWRRLDLRARAPLRDGSRRT